jgi:hypothetical protein
MTVCTCGNHQMRNGVWFVVTNSGCASIPGRPPCADADRASLAELLYPRRDFPLFRMYS